ncbi:hypothetical protein HanPSC8_Chr11g0486961 [Helianthus annuus]|nr:hypothetical protein HanPSC8_Chr11g0486961 [Helianthus annuus]
MLEISVKYDMCFAHEGKLVILQSLKHNFLFLSFLQPPYPKPYPLPLFSLISLSLENSRSPHLVAEPRRQHAMAVDRWCYACP